jgi:hypothetical protein
LRPITLPVPHPSPPQCQPCLPVCLPAHPPAAGEEAEEEDAEAAEAAQKLKIKSAHDLLEDERLAKEPVVDIDLDRWVGGWVGLGLGLA